MSEKMKKKAWNELIEFTKDTDEVVRAAAYFSLDRIYESDSSKYVLDESIKQRMKYNVDYFLNFEKMYGAFRENQS